MALTGEIIETTTLSPADVERMHALMQTYFLGVKRVAFERDLREKTWVIILRDPERRQVQGFSTLCLLEESVQGVPVRAFFSGDTIIDRPYWGSFELGRVWFRFLFARIEAEPALRWYWFLICKGYRTFRYLPIFFHRYYPSPETMPAFEQAVLEQLAERRFGPGYDASTGVIHCRDDYRLRPGIGDITAREMRDPHIAFFQQRNPGWVDGMELACLTELAYPNLKRMGLRLLQREGGG